jgi:hypothetical protein
VSVTPRRTHGERPLPIACAILRRSYELVWNATAAQAEGAAWRTTDEWPGCLVAAIADRTLQEGRSLDRRLRRASALPGDRQGLGDAVEIPGGPWLMALLASLPGYDPAGRGERA